MIVSDSRRFVCFQPWKSASTTLYARLEGYDSGRYPQGDHVNEVLGERINKHVGLAKFMRLPESSGDYYRFCFVRNPYDRIYSGFRQREFRLTTDQRYARQSDSRAAELRAVNAGFVPFLEFWAERYATTQRVGGGFLHEHVEFNGEPQLDFVGFAERFELDFADVCSRLGVSARRVNQNVRHGGALEGSAEDRHWYLDAFDPDSLAIVNDLYRRDLDLLGYHRVEASELGRTDGPPLFATFGGSPPLRGRPSI